MSDKHTADIEMADKPCPPQDIGPHDHLADVGLARYQGANLSWGTRMNRVPAISLPDRRVLRSLNMLCSPLNCPPR